jgi:hypothetical protein
MAVGHLRAVAIDVNDLDLGERFWAAVTGLPVRLRGARPKDGTRAVWPAGDEVPITARGLSWLHRRRP